MICGSSAPTATIHCVCFCVWNATIGGDNSTIALTSQILVYILKKNWAYSILNEHSSAFWILVASRTAASQQIGSDGDYGEMPTCLLTAFRVPRALTNTAKSLHIVYSCGVGRCPLAHWRVSRACPLPMAFLSNASALRVIKSEPVFTHANADPFGWWSAVCSSSNSSTQRTVHANFERVPRVAKSSIINGVRRFLFVLQPADLHALADGWWCVYCRQCVRCATGRHWNSNWSLCLVEINTQHIATLVVSFAKVYRSIER